MTPWQFSRCAEAYKKRKEEEHEHAVWIMWHAEALSRTEKLPSMKDLLAKQAKTSIDEGSIKARLTAYNKRLDNDRN